jgi:hypothetical protein
MESKLIFIFGLAAAAAARAKAEHDRKLQLESMRLAVVAENERKAAEVSKPALFSCCW